MSLALVGHIVTIIHADMRARAQFLRHHKENSRTPIRILLQR
jgi:hypothetical protein